MSRAGLGVATVLLAAAVAAGGELVAGWGNVVTKAQLDALAFTSALDPSLRGSQFDATSYEALATGVWLSAASFPQGETIYAWLVVKNKTAQRVGINMQFEFCREPMYLVNSCDLHLKQTAGATRWEPAPLYRVNALLSGPLLVVPAKGYYCVRLDLNRLDKSGRLPRGEYEFFWDYARLKSNTVRFTVGEPRAAAGNPQQRPAERVHDVALLSLRADGYDCVEHRDRIAFAAKGISAEWKLSRDIAALSVGVCGKYYVDPCDLPDQDEFMRLSVEWPRREGKVPLPVEKLTGFTITLQPKPSEVKPILLRDRMAVLLLVEALDKAGDARAVKPSRDHLMRMMDRDIPFDRPWAFTVPLPVGWHKDAGFAGRARVAALIASDDVVMPRADMKVLRDALQVLPGHAIWRGVLRTPYLTVSIPRP